MNSKEFKVHFIYNNKGQRVELGYPEIQALLFLNEHNFLSQPQMYQFYSFVQLVHPATFRKKTGKWLQAGLIKKKSIPLQSGHSVVIISLANAGLTVLKKLGYVNDKAKVKSFNLAKPDHALAIREVVLDVIANHRKRTNAQIYHAKGLYFVGIQPNVSLNNLTDPVLIYKTKHLGEDKLIHFTKYDNTIIEYEKTLLTSINPYKVTDTEVIADWLFEIEGHYLHLEIDCGNEQIRKPKSGNDSSFEGKLSRLQPQLNKKEIDSANYHVLFIMVDNRKDSVLTRAYQNCTTRIANVKQEIARFSEFKNWQFEMYVIKFSRATEFLKAFFRKIAGFIPDESFLLLQLVDAFIQKRDLQFSDWVFGYLDKDLILQKKYFLQDGYIPEKTLVYTNREHSTAQLLIPFFMEEGNVKKGEQLAILAEGINSGRYFNRFTKILVVYLDTGEFSNDILRKNKANSKNAFAMDTSNMLFISLSNFIGKYDTPKLFNESKKQLPYSSILEITI
ncbi:hypothetical protein [Lysinibacillus capsici]|uniref:hypothetical protein n=1 Tax=Lysinibacillus capsici TaxID=2115968 RepID=UPI000E1FBEAC|nr:hypothetical protein [Lysinibacillus capsici]RDV35228.1 hypothetical protein C7B89_01530 [Lysinibacillus capsici]